MHFWEKVAVFKLAENGGKGEDGVSTKASPEGGTCRCKKQKGRDVS